MTRDLIIAVAASVLIHGGVAGSSFFYNDDAPVAEAAEETPTIQLDLPPPPEPEEPEVVDAVVSDEVAPTDVADLAPPMQNDVPSAVIDSPFVQRLQAPPPPGLNRPSGSIVIPTNTRPAISGGTKMANLFNLADLDQKPEARVRINPVYPFEMRRSGVKGNVLVGFIVDSNGNVREPYIVKSSSPGFEQAAIDAVLKWKFKPGKKGGVAVNTRVQQPLDFSLTTQ
jgi:protein TonB